MLLFVVVVAEGLVDTGEFEFIALEPTDVGACEDCEVEFIT